MADDFESIWDVFEVLKKQFSSRLYLVKTAETKDNEISIRSDFEESSEAIKFVEIYGKITHTSYIVRSSLPEPRRYRYRKLWVCQHSYVRKRIAHLHRNDVCKAYINILIKKVNRSTSRNDPFLRLKPPLPVQIKIRYEHSHCTTSPGYLRTLRMSNEAKERFYEYFESGVRGIKAKQLHEQRLQEENVVYMDDGAINPKMYQVYRLYKLWRHEKKLKKDADSSNMVVKHVVDPVATTSTIKQELNEQIVNHKVSKESECIVKIEPDNHELDDSYLADVANVVLQDLDIEGDLPDEVLKPKLENSPNQINNVSPQTPNSPVVFQQIVPSNGRILLPKGPLNSVGISSQFISLNQPIKFVPLPLSATIDNSSCIYIVKSEALSSLYR